MNYAEAANAYDAAYQAWALSPEDSDPRKPLFAAYKVAEERFRQVRLAHGVTR